MSLGNKPICMNEVDTLKHHTYRVGQEHAHPCPGQLSRGIMYDMDSGLGLVGYPPTDLCSSCCTEYIYFGRNVFRDRHFEYNNEDREINIFIKIGFF